MLPVFELTVSRFCIFVLMILLTYFINYVLTYFLNMKWVNVTMIFGLLFEDNSLVKQFLVKLRRHLLQPSNEKLVKKKSRCGGSGGEVSLQGMENIENFHQFLEPETAYAFCRFAVNTPYYV